jgi:DNA-binding NarL/FixJ family response regulator
VLVADDEVRLQAGITRLLEDTGIEVVAELNEASGIVAVAQRLKPHVAIIDVQMLRGGTDNGLNAAIAVKGC